MSLYFPALFIHLTCVLISVSFFTVRFVWMWQGNSLLQARWVKISPHIIDSLLLLSAIGLMFIVDQYPFINDWLTVKLFALVVYIVAGTIALKRGKTLAIRTIAGAFSIVTVLYMMTVALSRHPLGFLSTLL